MSVPFATPEQRYRAKVAVHRALRNGTLVKPTRCEACGCEPEPSNLVAHHWHGYDDAHALDVQWLCRSCHNKVHATPAYLARSTFEQRSAIGRKFGSLGGRKSIHAMRERYTPEELREIKAHAGRAAGLATAARHTPAERSEIGRKAAATRKARAVAS